MHPHAHFETRGVQDRGLFREEKLGLRPDLFTVFLATGGNGANNHFDLLPALVKRADRCQAIVICGKNKQAYNDLVHWRANHPEFNCYIEGYSEVVHLLMQVSDVIVTRGGTTTCAKALHFKCPIVFNAFGGIMPQEESTWKYLRERGRLRQDRVGRRLRPDHRLVAHKARGLHPHARQFPEAALGGGPHGADRRTGGACGQRLGGEAHAASVQAALDPPVHLGFVTSMKVVTTGRSAP